jgi:hypothetical protein
MYLRMRKKMVEYYYSVVITDTDGKKEEWDSTDTKKEAEELKIEALCFDNVKEVNIIPIEIDRD